jgi:hypothetical protein
MKIIDYDPDSDITTVTEFIPSPLPFLVFMLLIEIFEGELEWLYFETLPLT